MLNSNKGQAAILLTILITSVILLIILATSVIVIAEIKSSRNIGDSVIAFYAADAGVERCLYGINHPGDGIVCSAISDTPTIANLTNNATYNIDYSTTTSFTSMGTSKPSNIVRKLEIIF